MRVLVVLENHFFIDEKGKVWCDRVVGYGYLRRYLEVFPEVLVCGRCGTINSKKTVKMLRVDGPHVEFLPLPDFRGAKEFLKQFGNIQKVVEGVADDVDCAIMRAPTHLVLATYPILKKHKKPFALEFMMAANRMVEGMGPFRFILNPAINSRFKYICKRANGVSYVTETILQQKYPCMAILDPTNKNYFTSSYSSIDLQDSFYCKRKVMPTMDNCRLIHVGYMDSERKGQRIAIASVAELINCGCNVSLRLVGDGEKRKELERYATEIGVADKVDFLGSINDKHELAKVLRQSDIMVFPTMSEGLPRVIIEAMANSLVCFASPVDGIPELLDADYLVKRSPDDYKEKICNLLGNPKIIENNSKRNYKKSLSYSAHLIDQRRTVFYNRLKECVGKNE